MEERIKNRALSRFVERKNLPDGTRFLHPPLCRGDDPAKKRNSFPFD
jgi:hypothetical protein